MLFCLTKPNLEGEPAFGEPTLGKLSLHVSTFSLNCHDEFTHSLVLLALAIIYDAIEITAYFH